MRIRGWLGVVAAVASVGVGGCRRDRVPPQSPPPPRMDTSNMGRAGFPDQHAIPSGNTGEGTGGSGGEGSAVKELKPGEPINVGVPGEKNPAEQEKPQDRR